MSIESLDATYNYNVHEVLGEAHRLLNLNPSFNFFHTHTNATLNINN
jgi:hypothetical protein